MSMSRVEYCMSICAHGMVTTSASLVRISMLHSIHKISRGNQ